MNGMTLRRNLHPRMTREHSVLEEGNSSGSAPNNFGKARNRTDWE
jgi:hypothetical protein